MRKTNMNKLTAFTALAVCALIIAETHGEEKKAKTLKIGKIEWYLDYDEAMKVAKERKQPLWLHFGEHPG